MRIVHAYPRLDRKKRRAVRRIFLFGLLHPDAMHEAIWGDQEAKLARLAERLERAREISEALNRCTEIAEKVRRGTSTPQEEATLRRSLRVLSEDLATNCKPEPAGSEAVPATKGMEL